MICLFLTQFKPCIFEKYLLRGYCIWQHECLTSKKRQLYNMDYTEKAFEQLYKERYRQMYRLAYSMLEDDEEARDVVSQAFANLWQNKPQVADGAIGGYLLASTRNLCLNVMRQRKLRQEMEKQYQQEQEEKDELEHQELIEELQNVINDNLTEQDRRILSLHYEEEMTYNETAQALGISYSAVNKHVTRSLSRIRSIFMKSNG